MTNIAAERAALTEQGLQMRTREQWGAVFNYTTDRACDIPATRLFLHIAVVTPTSMDATQQAIERIGISRFPNTGYSYNAAVWSDGVLLEGQPLTRRGAHTVNDFGRTVCPNHGGPLTAPGSPMNLNVNARALVLPQNVQHPVTDAQVDSAARWAAAQKRAGYVSRDARWHGHRCVAAKSCPGDIGYARIPELEQLTEHYTVNGLVAPPQPTPVPPQPIPPPWDGHSYPGPGAFVVGQKHPAVTVLGERLVAHGFIRNHDGNGYQPGPTFTVYDVANTHDFQVAQGWSGTGADGYPGPLTWDRLMAQPAPPPPTYQHGLPFPGANYFGPGRSNSYITEMGKALVAHGFGGHYTKGPGPTWSEADRQNYAAWQRHLGYSGSDADGIPGRASWTKLFA